MDKFIRFANSHFQDLLVGKSEEVGDGNDRLHDNFPYSLCSGEFKGVLLHLPEQPADGLLIIEPLDKGEYVMLQFSLKNRIILGFCVNYATYQVI